MKLDSQQPCECCLSRREFICAAGASMALLSTGQAGFASAGAKRTIRVAFLRPDVDRYFMGWPGAAYDIKAHQAQYTKILTEAAARLNVNLDIEPGPIAAEKAALAFAERVKASPQDGVMMVLLSLNEVWAPLSRFIQERGETPVFIFSPLGTSFLVQIQPFMKLSNARRMFLASTPDLEWLAIGLRMLRTVSDMRDTRICVVQGRAAQDVVLEATGATLHYVPFQRLEEEYVKVEATKEVQRIASQYEKQARKIVEPKRNDIVEAAKHVLVCRRIMEAEGCQGIAVDCLPHVQSKRVPPPCLAFSHLNDSGTPAACQADWPAAISLRLAYLLVERPGFMQNICVNTADNTLMGSHCTSPTRLAGPGAPAAPYILRTHAESDLGVSTQVLWPVEQPITVMKFSDPAWGKMPGGMKPDASSIVLGSGRVTRNLDTPPSGGCRTAVEVKLDGVDDVRKLTALHHQLFILGNHVNKFRAYSELAGIKALPL